MYEYKTCREFFPPYLSAFKHNKSSGFPLFITSKSHHNYSTLSKVEKENCGIMTCHAASCMQSELGNSNAKSKAQISTIFNRA